MLLAKARWLFPLYGSKPPHWVLGWADLTTTELHIFDGSPELQSYTWAEPVCLFDLLLADRTLTPKLQALVENVETVFTALGRMEVDVQPWKFFSHSPTELHRQMNGYACGFFLIHAMRAIINGDALSTITDDQTSKVKSDTLDLILDNISCVRICFFFAPFIYPYHWPRLLRPQPVSNISIPEERLPAPGRTDIVVPRAEITLDTPS